MGYIFIYMFTCSSAAFSPALRCVKYISRSGFWSTPIPVAPWWSIVEPRYHTKWLSPRSTIDDDDDVILLLKTGTCSHRRKTSRSSLQRLRCKNLNSLQICPCHMLKLRNIYPDCCQYCYIYNRIMLYIYTQWVERWWHHLISRMGPTLYIK